MATAIKRVVTPAPDHRRITLAHTAQTYALKPVQIAGLGVLIAENDAAANAVNTFLLDGGIYEADITAGVTVAQGDKVYYNTAADEVTNVAPAAGFVLGRAKKDGSAAGGYVEVLHTNLPLAGGSYIAGGGTPNRYVALSGSTALTTGTGVLESIVATGATTADTHVNVMVRVPATNGGYIKRAYVSAADTIQVTFSCEGGSAATLDWSISRSAS